MAGIPRDIATILQAANSALEKVGKLADSQKLFASAISHELRTPLAVNRLELEQIDHPSATKAIAEIDNAVHKLEHLTMLARLEGAERLGLRSVPLHAAATSAVARLAPLVYSKHHSLEVVNDGATTANAVPVLLGGLIFNLVENAVEHTPANTHVVVQVGPGARLSVTDNGPGMTTAMLPSNGRDGIAKPAGGIGLGLLIVRCVADLHGATLDLRSVHGQGTTVALTFAN